MTDKETILVIDDEEVVCKSCEQILTRLGYQIEIAKNGSLGLDKIREMKLDAVLIDLKMPGISGMEVLEKVIKIDQNIIPIVITGYATVESAVEAMKRGAFDFLPKPFTPDELRIIVERGLEKRRLVKETALLREEKRKMEENFITLASHQLRSPLATIQQYFEVILEGIAGDLSAKPKEIIKRVRDKVDGLLKMIDDWLSLARTSQEQLAQRFAPFDLMSMMAKLVDFMQLLAKEKQVFLTIEANNSLPSILGDKESLEQTFTNIINNAIIYNRSRGQVKIRIIEEGDYLKVEIEDTGIGIPEKDLPLIFEQFYRVKNDKTRHINGTGLGLPIAKKIIEAHRGSIDVSSLVDKGTTFKVMLPKGKGIDIKVNRD